MNSLLNRTDTKSSALIGPQKLADQCFRFSANKTTMSRCFPYPPPGFLKVRDESGIFEKERQKEKKKERKERKKEERKENSYRENGVIKEKKHHKCKGHKHERSKEKREGGDHKTKRREENDQSQRSDFTEEHGQPIGIQKPSNSFESVDCESKRPRDSSISPSELTSHKKHRTGCDAGGTGTYGKGLWIQLPAPRSSEQLQQLNKQTYLTVPALHPKVSVASSSGPRDASITHDIKAQFKDGPSDEFPPLPMMSNELTGPDNLQWLFEEKHCGQEARRSKVNEETIPQVWSHACRMPSAGLCSLPYVLPY